VSRRCTRGDVLIQLAFELREYLGAADTYDEAMAQRLGLSRTDLRCVDVLERRGTMTAGALAQAIGLSTGAVTFLLDRLEAGGVVRRERDTEDRRRVLVEVVPAAARQALRLHEPMIADMRELAQRYKMEELGIIRDFLRDARRVYEDHAPLLRGGERRRHWR
jgi:DNA-binding MarR family transcriptional regulator